MMPRSKRILTGLAALVLAAIIWLPCLHFLFARPVSEFREARGLSPKARELAARHLLLWTEPALREQELRKMRASNAEWDFMGRSFLVWSLANMGLREPASKPLYLQTMDRIIDETLQLEKQEGMYFFLMPYAKGRNYVAQPAHSLFLDGEIALMLASRRVLEEKPEYKPRDKIKTPAGEKWITVAVQKARKESKINEIILSNAVDWRSDNINLIKQHYRKAPFFSEIFPYIETLYGFQCEKMMDFNLKSIDMLMNMFDIKIERILASTLNPAGTSNDLLVDILKKVAATTYLSGVGAKSYIDPRPFKDAKINFIWQEFKHPVYSQLHGEFIPYLSSIDLLFNCGIQKSREILRNL